MRREADADLANRQFFKILFKRLTIASAEYLDIL